MGTTITTLRVIRSLLDDPTGRHYGLGLIAASGVPAGSLYPVLTKLEKDGWIQGEWEDIDEAAEGRRRRRYYRLTGVGATGARTLLSETVRWMTPPARVGGGRKPGVAPA
jgi:DNA-binding MarR family transcriptional regulator